MSEQSRPELSLGKPPGNLSSKLGGVPRAWFWLLVVLQAATLGCLAVVLLWPGTAARPSAHVSGGTDSERLKSLALALQERGLPGEAADAWQAYLDATPAVEDRPQILYRIGRLHADAGQFAKAAAALVEAEQAAHEDDQELHRKVGRLLVECLEAQGLYGEADRERSRLVEVGTDEPGKARVVATVGGEPITEADADRMIRRRVDQQLALAGVSDDDPRRKQMLQQLSDPQFRRQALEELLLHDLMVRRARELELHQTEGFALARQAAIEQLLVARLTDRELGDLEPTDLELTTYYETVKDRFKQPESLEVVLLPVGKDGDGAGMLQQVQSAEDFRKLAAKASASEGPAKEPKGPPVRTVRRGDDPLLSDTGPLFELAEGQWSTEPMGKGEAKYLVLVEKKNPECIPPLEVVQPRVRAEYAMKKERALLDKLRREILEHYEVRFLPMPTRQKPATPDEESP